MAAPEAFSETTTDQAGFEQLVLRLSRQFLSLPTDRFDAGLASALRALGEQIDVDRLAFFTFGRNGRTTEKAYGWHAVGCEVQAAEDDFDPMRFPWCLERILELEPLYVERPEDLPADAGSERPRLIALGIRSMVLVPVAQRHDLLGFVQLEWVREPRAWSSDGLALLKVVGQILAAALVRHRAEKALAHEKERALVTLAAIGDGVIRTDSAGLIDYLNPTAERLTGWSLADAIGRQVGEVYSVVGELSGRARADPVARCLSEQRRIATPGLSTLIGRAGHQFTVRHSATPIIGGSGVQLGAVLVFEDLTEVRGLAREMAYLTSHDTLTGLINRAELEIRLEAALEAAHESSSVAALVKIELLHFRLVNDAGGHIAGDELLQQVARALRDTVGEEGLPARVGGDEFAVLLPTADRRTARGHAEAILDVFRPFRFRWGGQPYDVGASVALVPIDATSHSASQILKAADTACYLAHEAGGQRVHESSSADSATVARSGQVQWVHRLRRALDEDRFCLYRQRIAPLRDDRGDLHEILIRLIDERGRHVEPARFIPIAEQYRLGPSIDRWVLRTALRLLDQADCPIAGDPVSINLSGQSLDDESFLDFVIDELDGSRISPGSIFFEITETAAVAHLSRAVAFIAALGERGCRFILDDFGSGLSSFAYLKSLPVDLLKIDGAFVRSMEHDPIQREMVRSIHQIGRLMGLETIAEWVEDAATYALVRELEIDYVQGFYIHRPEPLEAPRHDPDQAAE